MNPDYFFSRLCFNEASLYLIGLDRRKRDLTFAASHLGNCIISLFKGKGDCFPKWLTDDPIFSEPKAKQRPPKDIEKKVRGMVAEANAFMNRDREKEPKTDEMHVY